MTQKELLIQLIKDDLVIQSLINSFEAIGFYSEDYCLDLGDTIFKILGIDDNEELFELYLKKCKKMGKPNIFRNKKLLGRFSEDIYEMLITHKQIIGR